MPRRARREEGEHREEGAGGGAQGGGGRGGGGWNWHFASSDSQDRLLANIIDFYIPLDIECTMGLSSTT